jgi:ABC-type phosphate/phosphonate transport system substrate-binding protein
MKVSIRPTVSLWTRVTISGFVLWALMLMLTPAWAAQSNQGLKPATLRLLWSRHAFLNMNPNDVQASFKALADTVGRRRGYLITCAIEVGDVSTLEAAVRRDEFELLIVDSWTYLGMNIGNAAQPRFVSSEQGKIGKKYHLLVNQSSGFGSVANLRGTEINLYEIANTSLGRAWLDTLLRIHGQEDHETFFSSVTSVGKPMMAVLPVFFGKKDACLVDNNALEVMAELNPQVGKKVRVLASSEVLVDGFICFRSSPWASETFKRELANTLEELHREPAGQQMLSLVKANQLVPFQEEHLATVRKLRANWEALKNKTKK